MISNTRAIRALKGVFLIGCCFAQCTASARNFEEDLRIRARFPNGKLKFEPVGRAPSPLFANMLQVHQTRGIVYRVSLTFHLSLTEAPCSGS